MHIRPAEALAPNSYEFETDAMIAPSGFREYDARWQFPEQINLAGFQLLGMALATQMRRHRVPGNAIVVGHDYRSYSASVKHALTIGLIAGGANVYDIGLALSPMAYFAQFHLDVPAVAMVTASHNENGWTGVKVGLQRPVTHGTDEMSELKDIALNGEALATKGGTYRMVPGVAEAYLTDLADKHPVSRKLKVVVACGNGTAGAFAPALFERLGVDVVPLHCELDHSFPHHNPNPEDVAMLRELGSAVRDNGADIGFAFDGDGDRCGVVDEKGEEIFSDKIGLLIARGLAAKNTGKNLVVDVKSTGLFENDPILRNAGMAVEYWKTGHSHIKRRLADTGALAAFEKSGHFFFGAPHGRGYDDGLLSALMVCQMLDRVPGRSLSSLYGDLPKTWQTPTLSAHCPDDAKYGVVEKVTSHFLNLKNGDAQILGGPIASVVTTNGARVTLEDGTWGLVRASSNKPEIVVVIESPTSGSRMRAMFDVIDGALRSMGEIGDYNQPIE
jgi:phosphomannomutase/phosphoglucomutase